MERLNRMTRPNGKGLQHKRLKKEREKKERNQREAWESKCGMPFSLSGGPRANPPTCSTQMGLPTWLRRCMGEKRHDLTVTWRVY